MFRPKGMRSPDEAMEVMASRRMQQSAGQPSPMSGMAGRSGMGPMRPGGPMSPSEEGRAGRDLPSHMGPAAMSAPRGGKKSSDSVAAAVGDQGDQVMAIQSMLKSMGYDVGKSDGIFGPKTLAAVKAFQNDMGLKADGVVGQKTMDAFGDFQMAHKGGLLVDDDTVAINEEGEQMKGGEGAWGEVEDEEGGEGMSWFAPKSEIKIGRPQGNAYAPKNLRELEGEDLQEAVEETKPKEKRKSMDLQPAILKILRGD